MGATPTDLIDEAIAQAAVDAVFPVEFHTVEPGDRNGEVGGWAPTTRSFPAPPCWLLADLVSPAP